MQNKLNLQNIFPKWIVPVRWLVRSSQDLFESEKHLGTCLILGRSQVVCISAFDNEERRADAPVLAALAPFLPFNFSNKLKLPQKYAKRCFFPESSVKNIHTFI